MGFEHRNDVAGDEYIETIRLKTSALLVCVLRIGTVLGGAPAKDVNDLYCLNEKIGLTFQLQDDFLDVYGDSKASEKAIRGNIIDNKKIYILVDAFNRANAQRHIKLEHRAQLEDFDRQEKIDAVTTLYSDIDINRLAQNKVATYYEESRKYLVAVQVPTEKGRELTTYAW